MKGEKFNKDAYHKRQYLLSCKPSYTWRLCSWWGTLIYLGRWSWTSSNFGRPKIKAGKQPMVWNPRKIFRCDEKWNGHICYKGYLLLFLAPLDSRHESQNKANFPLRSVLNEPEILYISTSEQLTKPSNVGMRGGTTNFCSLCIWMFSSEVLGLLPSVLQTPACLT